MLRTSQAIAAGIHPRTLYHLRDSGKVSVVSRGVYRLSDLPDLENPDLAVVAARIPTAIVCMVSALAWHRITTQVPHRVDIALPRGAERPRVEHPPLRVFRFTKALLEPGVETHLIEGMHLKVYSPARTVADCFRFRNRIGLDVAVEGLRACLRERKTTNAKILHFARLLRVEKVILPYLEAGR